MNERGVAGVGNINGGSSHANGNGQNIGNGPPWCDPLITQGALVVVRLSGWRKSTFSEAGNCVEVSGGWRKARRSMGNGNCVEVRGWRKARRSMNNGNCAEAASAAGAVLVRDTADRGGVVLSFPPGAWADFTGRLARAALGALRGAAGE